MGWFEDERTHGWRERVDRMQGGGEWVSVVGWRGIGGAHAGVVEGGE